MTDPSPKHPFLRACLRLPVTQTPIWIMRQAGRYLPEYRALRERAGDFLTLCKHPEWAAEATLQPLNRFPLDAAILFSDILVIPEAMGMPLHFSKNEGPVLEQPVRHERDLDRLTKSDPEESLSFVFQAIQTIRRDLNNRVPLIGFSGSPWTLATYMVEGGSSKKFRWIKGMLYERPDLLHQLLDRLSAMVTRYLNTQIRHGAQAIQIFDTWGGLLTPQAFREFSLRTMRTIVEGLERTGPDGERVPIILFAKGCGHLLESMADTGCDVLGLDWMTDLGEARQRVGHRVALQGNMDPAVLYASPNTIRSETRDLLKRFGKHPGHIFNLGHGITPDIQPEHVAALVDAVHTTVVD